MKRFVIDCDKIETESQFWDAYLQATQPQGADLFGRNLNAFNDALAGGPGFPGECELTLIDSSKLGVISSGKFLRSLHAIDSEPGNEAVTVVFR